MTVTRVCMAERDTDQILKPYTPAKLGYKANSM